MSGWVPTNRNNSFKRHSSDVIDLTDDGPTNKRQQFQSFGIRPLTGAAPHGSISQTSVFGRQLPSFPRGQSTSQIRPAAGRSWNTPPGLSSNGFWMSPTPEASSLWNLPGINSGQNSPRSPRFTFKKLPQKSAANSSGDSPPVQKPNVGSGISHHGEQLVAGRNAGFTRKNQTAYSPQPSPENSTDSSDVIDVTPTMSQDGMMRLTRRLLSFYEATKQHDACFHTKCRLRDLLFNICKQLYPQSGLFIVGSSTNGYGSATSDMDLCLLLTPNNNNNNTANTHSAALTVLQRVLSLLRKCHYLKRLMLIRAKVPIIKFVDSVSGIECDLNVNNSVGIRNTHLLRVYSQLDERLRALVLCVKFWAKSQNINDASQQTLSSYSLALMTINYLQCGVSPPVVPSLQVFYPEQFDISVDVRTLQHRETIAFVSDNKQTVGELFTGFLRYYATSFSFAERVVCVRLGTTLPRTAAQCNNSTNQWKFICIEEPFDRSNTARAVYSENVFQRIQRVFRRSSEVLQETSNFDYITLSPV